MGASTPTTTLDLTDFGNIPADYRHEARVAVPLEPLVLPGTVCKWYHVHRVGVPVPATLDAQARCVLAEAAPSGAWTLSYGLNVALLHQSTTHAFLIAGVWRAHNEWWERIYAYDLQQGGPFQHADRDGLDGGVACVWEFGVICHERQAWQRYLFSNRNEAAKQAWLADVYAGEV
jgi:hypothetical protein